MGDLYYLFIYGSKHMKRYSITQVEKVISITQQYHFSSLKLDKKCKLLITVVEAKGRKHYHTCRMVL